jgi:hypothetical protein
MPSVLFVVAWGDETSVAWEIYTQRFEAEQRADSLQCSGYNVTFGTYEL